LNPGAPGNPEKAVKADIRLLPPIIGGLKLGRQNRTDNQNCPRIGKERGRKTSFWSNPFDLLVVVFVHTVVVDEDTKLGAIRKIQPDTETRGNQASRRVNPDVKGHGL
jgi:hypothetical protein